MGRVDLIAFDKTGTLTEGRPQVTGLHPAPATDADDLLRVAASVEGASEHPLARAILAEAEARGLTVEPVSGFDSTTGGGRLRALWTVFPFRPAPQASARVRRRCPGGTGRRGKPAVHVALGGRYLGRIDLSDPPKPDAAEAVAALRAQGVRVAMLSGRWAGSGRGGRRNPRHPRGSWGPVPRRQEGPAGAVARRGPEGRLRGRRDQRCARSRRRRCRRGARHRHGCGYRGRPCGAGLRQTLGSGHRARRQPPHACQHRPEPRLGLRLQRGADPGGGGGVWPFSAARSSTRCWPRAPVAASSHPGRGQRAFGSRR